MACVLTGVGTRGSQRVVVVVAVSVRMSSVVYCCCSLHAVVAHATRRSPPQRVSYTSEPAQAVEPFALSVMQLILLSKQVERSQLVAQGSPSPLARCLAGA